MFSASLRRSAVFFAIVAFALSSVASQAENERRNGATGGGAAKSGGASVGAGNAARNATGGFRPGGAAPAGGRSHFFTGGATAGSSQAIAPSGARPAMTPRPNASRVVNSVTRRWYGGTWTNPAWSSECSYNNNRCLRCVPAYDARGDLVGAKYIRTC